MKRCDIRNSKPHIYAFQGRWVCSVFTLNGWGCSPAEAWRDLFNKTHINEKGYPVQLVQLKFAA